MLQLKNLKRQGRTSKSTKKCMETASSVKIEDENNLTQDMEGIADKDVKRIKRPSVHSISNYIKREKIVEIKNKDDRKFLPIDFPPNTLIFQIGHTIKSVRKYQVGKKLTYVKFHDTIRPSFHTICTKYKTSNSVKRIPFVLNYDEDSDLLWNDDESGESINYATDSEEDMVEEDSFECSWIEEGEEYNTKKVDLSFRMIQPNMKICFLKDQKKYKFCD
ncbi:putative Chromatin assembly factor 1 subunit A protein [Trachipleistophora hominis]|uniref:Putative Chromatin assembly factor 1 subunit A protein n=1 Tax=Trachipleistophora hominis TaxID=72359 RepID=L7JSP1_TRAHO|nr:putative Chromatin assembly factor 1 subunit A protein [Trachipleistophora hominis]